MKGLRPYAEVHAPKKSKGRRERFPRNVIEALRAYVRRLPCLVTDHECRGQIEAAHVRTKATGAGDWGNLVPLCARHHTEQHYRGLRWFEHRYQVRLAPIARRTTVQWLKAYPEYRKREIAAAAGKDG